MESYDISKIHRPFEKNKNPIFKHTYRIEFKPEANVDSLISELSKLNFVEYVEKIPTDYSYFDPNDPKENDGSLWFLNKVKAYQAWDITQGSGNVIVAVVDDAVYTNHEDIIDNLWTNPNEIAGNGIDDDANGYIDDINGADVADHDSNTNPPTSLVSTTVFSHGSHCAGIAGGVTNNGKGIASIGSHIKIMAVKASRDAASTPGIIEYGWEGIQYAVSKGAKIVSLSWGNTTNSQTYQNLVNSYEAQGVLIVAAAGNAGIETPLYPAAYNYVVGVGATDESDYKASYSNYGTWVDIMAPGSNIMGILCTGPTNYSARSGTSMATPMVASLAALIKSYNPALTPAEIRTCLYNSADKIDALNPNYIGKMGAGRINALEAIVDALPSACITPYNLNVTSITATSAQLNWSGTANSTYTLQVREVGAASWNSYSVSTTSYTFTASSCKNYEFRVMANCGTNGSSPYSATLNFSSNATGPQNYCKQPIPDSSFGWLQNVQFAGINNTSGDNDGYNNALCSIGTATIGSTYPVTLTPGFGTYSYNEYWRVYIDYNQDGDFADANELAYESGTSSTTAVNGNITIPSTALVGNTRMRVMMKWFGTGDMTMPEPCVAFNYGEVEDYTLTIGGTCGTPTTLSSNTITSTGATLTWAAVTGASSYTIQYKPSSATTWLSATATTNSKALTALTAATTYDFKVMATCSSGASAYSSTANFTTAAATATCGTPTTLSSSSITSTGATLAWAAVTGASSYTIQYKPSSATTWLSATATTNSKALTALTAATAYNFKVMATCSSGASAYSSTANFTTAAATATCGTPTTLSSSSITSTGATLAWAAVTGASSYTIQYKPSSATTWLSATATTNSKALTALTAATTYNFKVMATCSSGASAYSSTANFTTAAATATCGTPTTLSSSSITSTGATTLGLP
ncbi:MAG: S8 family serine peptidase [Sphingobacteriales bacterium]|nr:S8 family serine peptidase [Sphingobacteriales bacterium]